ncbi:hypothetical protein [Streptomyces sp. NPDC060001]|uniref:hypothetical protein n=1 Tax=Streptomyces sp. NPDC060001 TaxID=3347032 RepID=UPI003676FBDD
MHLATQLFLSVALVLLAAGIAVALFRFPKDKHQASRERIRSLSGLIAVLISDAAIVIIAIWGASALGGLDEPASIGLITGAFTAVSTMTTAYLGIKAVSNTAQVLTAASTDRDEMTESESKSSGDEPAKPAGTAVSGKGRKGVLRSRTRTSWSHRA